MTLILRKPWNRQPPAGTYATSSVGSNGLVAYLPGTAPYDASPHRRAITSTTHAPSIPTREGLAYNFNGTSHQFNVACPFLSEFTCVCWVYYNESLGNNDSYYNIFSRGAVFENNTNFAIGIRQNAGGTFQARLFMYARNGASLVGAESASNVIVNNNWYRLVWTWKSGSQGAWVNGVRVITATATNGADGAQPLIFGGANSYTSTDRRAQYPLLDMRVYSRAWSDAEVNWDWTEGRSAWTPFSPRRTLIPVSAGGGAYTLPAAKGTFSLTGNAAALTAARTVSAAKGTFTLTGNAATFARGYAMTAAHGQFALTGNAATLAYGRAIVAAKGTFSLTGNDATLTYTPAGVTYTLTAARGTFTLTGQTAALSQPARVMSAAAGSFTLDGKAATLQLGSGMVGRRGRRTKIRFLPHAEPEAQETPQETTGLVSEEAMTLLIQEQAGKAIRKARVSATKRRLEIQSHNVKALESTLMEWF